MLLVQYDDPLTGARHSIRRYTLLEYVRMIKRRRRFARLRRNLGRVIVVAAVISVLFRHWPI